MPNTPRLTEIGGTGLKRWGGQIAEEFLPELTGSRGIATYKEMRDNDAMIGAILFAIEMLIRGVKWKVEPGKENDKKHARAAEFVQECMHDMSMTWGDTISEILSFLPFGWSYHEIVYKPRDGKESQYNDGLIGWRKLPIRSQDSLLRWDFNDEDGSLLAMVQTPPPHYRTCIVPIEKALLFRTRANKGNPEGRSVLRNAYRAWYFKRRLEELEGIGIERNLAGLPVLTPPDGLDIWDTNDPQMVSMRHDAETLVQNIRRDTSEGIVKPFGWELTLLSAGGGSSKAMDTDKIIQRYDQRIAMTVLADFILLGHEKVGSFALSSDKTNLFAVALGAWVDSIADVFNRYAIPRLMDLNPSIKPEVLPKLTHEDIETPDLTALSTFIKDMTGVGILVPGPKLEGYVRTAANLPEEDDAEDNWSKQQEKQDAETEAAIAGAKRAKETAENPPEEDPKAEEAAKRFLGRS